MRSRLQHGYCIGVSRRSAQATAGKELAQGPYMAARAGVEPTTSGVTRVNGQPGQLTNKQLSRRSAERVLGQNSSGQNGMYGQNGIRTKWYWTKWHGQNGTDKMVRIKYYE